MIEKIVSGGQTGVDQAALAMATEAGLPIGGWCPKGGLDANGVCVLDDYPTLKQASTPDPNERTMLNIDDSDGTLIIVPRYPLPDSIIDGTRLTIDYAAQQNKPHLIVSLSAPTSALWFFIYLFNTLSQALKSQIILEINRTFPDESQES